MYRPISFDTKPAYDRRTVGRTDRHEDSQYPRWHEKTAQRRAGKIAAGISQTSATRA